MLTVAVSEDAQKRLIVYAEAGGERRPTGHVAHALVRDVHRSGGDLLDLAGRHAGSSAGGREREPEQVIGPDARQRATVPPNRRPRATQYQGRR
jgi:hypothetical protein